MTHTDRQISRFAMVLGILGLAFLLSACTTGPTWHDVRKDDAIWDRVVRAPYIPLERLQVACVRQNGHFTRDKAACMVQGKGTCYYLTATGDVRHDAELTAMCNGYRRI